MLCCTVAASPVSIWDHYVFLDFCCLLSNAFTGHTKFAEQTDSTGMLFKVYYYFLTLQASISCYTLPGQSPINDSKSTLDFLSMFMIEFFAKFKIEFAS